MFCHLYRLFDRTTLALNEYEECNPECKLYIEKNKCQIVEDINESLTKEKYNWLLETRIRFNPPRDSKSGNTRYVAAIFLIHPAHNDMCIMYHLKHNKDDSWDPGFKLYFNTEAKDFLNLAALNTYLKKNGYSGRKLLITDFIKEEIKSEKN